MNNSSFKQAQEEYEAGNYEVALTYYLEVLKTNPPAQGELCHNIGNCFMKLHRYDEAINAYKRALTDSSYSKASAVQFNMGNAYLVKKDNGSALEAFKAAATAPNYENAYKAYFSMGTALLRLNHVEEAAVSFRRAALEENNPTPAKALVKLGGCFMTLKRPEDALTTYEAAINFAADDTQRGNALVGYAQACAYLGKRQEAIAAFDEAQKLTGYTLSEEAKFEYERLQGKNVPQPEPVSTFVPDATDPYNVEESIIPSAENTSFFTISEDELTAYSKQNLKEERKNRHVGLKIALVVILIIAALAGVAAAMYYLGYGYPSQQAVVEEYFAAETQGKSVSQYWTSDLSEEDLATIALSVPKGSKIKVLALDKNMTESKLTVAQTIEDGGTMKYDITMKRKGLTWELVSLTPRFDSE